MYNYGLYMYNVHVYIFLEIHIIVLKYKYHSKHLILIGLKIPFLKEFSRFYYIQLTFK